MRKNRENQMPLTPLWPDHRLGDELQMISRILDANPQILPLVLQDLSDKVDPCNGSPGLSAEQVVRCAVIKNWHGLSYAKLAFHVHDSASFRAFCRLPLGWSPGKSCLQENISRIQASTWESITRALVGWADDGVWKRPARCGWMPRRSRAASATLWTRSFCTIRCVR